MKQQHISCRAYRQRYFLALVGLLYGAASIFSVVSSASAQYADWKHSGSMYILTTPEGSNLPASTSVTDFPLLVRLHSDHFRFSEAEAGGSDIRFSAGEKPLSYEIEEWDKETGTASIWVRIPSIRGNDRQEIKIHWGKTDAPSASDGKAVFNASNGYIGVWHLGSEVRDVVGKLESEDKGTKKVEGVIGGARYFPGKMGVFCGKDIQALPSGGMPHCTQAWFRPDTSSGRIVSWGNEKGQGKVEMKYQSPPQIRMDCYFSNGNVSAEIPDRAKGWTHAVHTFEDGQAIMYINGEKRGEGDPRHTQLAIERPARMWIGGWYNNYDYIGDIDEVRISGAARSAEWVHLEYENQKPMQTLVGSVVQDGDEIRLSASRVTLKELESVDLAAKAGGAQKIYWILKQDDNEKVVAVDRLSYRFDAGRVNGTTYRVVRFKALYPDGIRTRDIHVTITENIPEPVFALQAPSIWNGRDTIEVVPRIRNLKAMSSKDAGNLAYRWTVSGGAVIKRIVPGRLILERSQYSGEITVTLALNNGGSATIQTATITVKESPKDTWVQRVPAKDEKPTDNQFYARDDKNEGTLHYNGTLDEAADSVFLKVYAGDKFYDTQKQKVSADKTYSLSAKLKAGLVKYRLEFGTKKGNSEKVLDTAKNLICGDAYIIQGQSNAEAWTDPPHRVVHPYRSDWLRSFGTPINTPDVARTQIWGNALSLNTGENACKLQIGYWGVELGKQLIEQQKVPICILNGAQGGTRIDQHQQNAEDPEDVKTIYGRLLWRVRQARLTHGIRGVLWHQGENDQGAAGPDGCYGWETYQQYFIDMAAAWKQDFPNIQHYYIFQIWPKSCGMGINGSDDRLREVQRQLPNQFSNMSIMSTLGIRPPGPCHYPPEGYAVMARLIYPLVARNNYGKIYEEAVTPGNLLSARYVGDARDEIALQFDQHMAPDKDVAGQFYLDGIAGKVTGVRGDERVIYLKLSAPCKARTITYIKGDFWNANKSFLKGKNGIAALTFCNVPISSQQEKP
jgi:hypothetical protein